MKTRVASLKTLKVGRVTGPIEARRREVCQGVAGFLSVHPAENVRAGVAYLRDLLDRYSNNEQLALAAYNAGPGAVDKHGWA